MIRAPVAFRSIALAALIVAAVVLSGAAAPEPMRDAGVLTTSSASDQQSAALQPAQDDASFERSERRGLGDSSHASEHAVVSDELAAREAAAWVSSAARIPTALEPNRDPLAVSRAVVPQLAEPTPVTAGAPPATSWGRPDTPDGGPTPTIEPPTRRGTAPDAAGEEWLLARTGQEGDQPEPPAAIAEPWWNPGDGGQDSSEEGDEPMRYRAWESPAGRFTQLSVGGRHNCGLREDGTVFCWGDNSYGQTDAPSGNFIQVSAGASHSCGLREGGSVECWGETVYPEANFVDGSTVFIAQPDGPFVYVSAGSRASCGLRPDGRVDCWGGRADNSGGLVPQVPPDRFVQLSAGGDLCGLKADGTVLCWATNEGWFTVRGGPYAQISVGEWHTCFLRVNGEAVCSGGYLSRDNPIIQAPPGCFVQLSAGARHTCALRGDGSVVCWGSNAFGQSDPPEGSFRSVGAGGDWWESDEAHSCGLRKDGTIECWGGGPED